jgi:hypothetical protein
MAQIGKARIAHHRKIMHQAAVCSQGADSAHRRHDNHDQKHRQQPLGKSRPLTEADRRHQSKARRNTERNVAPSAESRNF